MLIHTVKKGDSLSRIAKAHGVDTQSLIRNNQLAYPDRLTVGQALVVEPDVTTYTVKQGDTLYAIAKAHGMSVSAILQANPAILDANKIYIGQSIQLTKKQAPERRIVANAYCYPNVERSVLNASLPFLTYVSPFSYEIRRDGSLSKLNDSAVIQTALAQRVAPLMVLTNISGPEGFNTNLATQVLQNNSAQRKLLDNILHVMQANGYRGLDVDFEYIRASDRDALNGFLTRAALRLHEYGYTLSTAVPPKARANQPGLLYEAMDYFAQGRAADMVLVMTYNWGYQHSMPMAISPLNQVERVIQYAVKEIPSEKILLGMNNYAFDWMLPYQKGRAAKLLSNIEAVNLAVAHWSEIFFDNTAMAPYFYYNDSNGAQHIVWFEDARSYEARLRLIATYNLCGAGYWNLDALFLPGFLVMSDMYDIKKVLT